MLIGSTVIGIAALLAAAIGLAAIHFEWQYRRRPGNKLELTAGDWQLEEYTHQRYRLVGDMEFRNLTSKLELILPEVHAELKLLSRDSLVGVTWTIRLIPQHPDEESRADDYWFAYVVKVGKTTGMKVVVEIFGKDLTQLQVAWLRFEYMTYGPEGRIPKSRHVIVPLAFPSIEEAPQRWRPTPKADVLPIRTHLLTHMDDPVGVVQRYVLPFAQPGDIVAIGESPVAIMQDRFIHPSLIKPGWLARRLCYFFLPTSSLATACGLQALIDIVGEWRVLAAFVIGAIAKILGRPGVFYQLAGEQARLIDDVTGTLPPYDQFIVLGPKNPQEIVNQIQKETGLAAAIVDVNDLKAVKILAASAGVSSSLLRQALISNPAGNANEQTPIVLIRPTEP